MSASRVAAWSKERLRELERLHLRRSLEPLECPQGPRVVLGGKQLINFSSNDYLGLANDPEVIEAARVALSAHGLGAGASRLVVGDTLAHQALETDLAQFEGTEAALLFNSGYAANIGVLAALFGPGDVIFSDALNHASLIDGCRLSRAHVVVYSHGDVDQLAALVRAHPGRHRAVVTDTVFSMDGDAAPLSCMHQICEANDVALVVDEAHATGVLGSRGGGLCEALGIDADVHIGTLSKALGGFGAYACTAGETRELLLNQARSLIFSTALPASLCVAARVALKKLQSPNLRTALWARIEQFDAGLREMGLNRPPAQSAIFSVVLGEAEVALKVAQALRDDGLLVKAIRPPTVPQGTSRLRIALSAGHTEGDIERLLMALRRHRTQL